MLIVDRETFPRDKLCGDTLNPGRGRAARVARADRRAARPALGRSRACADRTARQRRGALRRRRPRPGAHAARSRRLAPRARDRRRRALRGGLVARRRSSTSRRRRASSAGSCSRGAAVRRRAADAGDHHDRGRRPRVGLARALGLAVTRRGRGAGRSARTPRASPASPTWARCTSAPGGTSASRRSATASATSACGRPAAGRRDAARRRPRGDRGGSRDSARASTARAFETRCACSARSRSTRAPPACGLLLAGDAAGFVDPMTGDGLHLAMRGAVLAAREALSALETGRLAGAAAAWTGRAARRSARKLRFNRVLRRLVESRRPRSMPPRSGRAVAPGLVRWAVRYAGTSREPAGLRPRRRHRPDARRDASLRAERAAAVARGAIGRPATSIARWPSVSGRVLS